MKLLKIIIAISAFFAALARRQVVSNTLVGQITGALATKDVTCEKINEILKKFASHRRVNGCQLNCSKFGDLLNALTSKQGESLHPGNALVFKVQTEKTTWCQGGKRRRRRI